MSTSIKLPHGTWVLVADERQALLFANQGDAAYPDLRISRLFESPPNPRTSAQGTDRPGRKAFARRSSAVGQTDWHRQGEAQFAGKIVDTLFSGPPPVALIIAAPPAFLAELRQRLPKQARAVVLAEIDKDFTHLQADEIERRLLGLPAHAEAV